MTTLAQAQTASPALKDGSPALAHASEGRNRLRLRICGEAVKATSAHAHLQ